MLMALAGYREDEANRKKKELRQGKPTMNENNRLNARIAELEAENAKLRARIAELERK